MRGAALAVLAFFACSAAFCAAFPAMAASGAAEGAESALEAVSLRSIAGWLKASGSEGYVGADLARALGMTPAGSGAALDARQRGFRNAGELRVAQLLADGSLLFMVQGEDGEVAFYHCTSGGLRRALVSIPSRGAVLPLEGTEAESKFRAEVLYWEDKAANR